MSAVIELAVYTRNSVDRWRTLERECRRLNVRLRVRPFREVIDDQKSIRRCTEKPFGYLVFTIGFTPDDTSAVLSKLAGTRRPVAVLYEIAESIVALPMEAAASRRFACFLMADDRRAGKRMGDFMLGQGHRRVAYFLPFPRNRWAVQRFEGLRDAFAELNAADGVVPFVMDIFDVNSQNYVLAPVEPPDIARSSAQALYPDLLLSHTIAVHMRPHFEAALADQSITAWVGANDTVAIEGLKFLRQRGVPVPQRVAASGYDDSLEALGMGLTSYGFNNTGTVAAMINFIFASRPGRPRLSGSAPVIELPGEICVRASTEPL